MWIWCPASIQSPSTLLLRQPPPPPPPPHILPFPPPRSTPSRNLIVSAGENISGLGHSLIAALNTTSNPTPKKQNQDEEEEEEGRQMSGSDVLWALQRVAATRKSKNTKKRVVPSAGSRRKEDDPDYSNVKPLIVKSEWSSKLDDLEKRLQELSEMV